MRKLVLISLIMFLLAPTIAHASDTAILYIRMVVPDIVEMDEENLSEERSNIKKIAETKEISRQGKKVMVRVIMPR